MESVRDSHVTTFHAPTLPGWMAVSLVAHLLLVVLIGGPATSLQVSTPLSFTVDIARITPEIDTRPVLAEPRPDIQEPEKVATRAAPAAVEPERRQADVRSRTEASLPFDSYFHEVDKPAEPANDVLLRYPWIEYRQRIGGVVRVELLINEHGGLDSATVIEATPPGHFEQAAMEAVRKLQFKPAIKAGRYVKSRKTIEVVFDPNEHLSPSAQR